MRATFRISCSLHGQLGTALITADTVEILDQCERAFNRKAYSHGPDLCGGQLTVTRKDHKPRSKKDAGHADR